MPEMSMEEQNIAQNIKDQILNRVLDCLKIKLITKNEAQKMILEEDLLPTIAELKL